MNKVRFADDADNEAVDLVRSQQECERADSAVRALRDVKRRVIEFFNAVDHVTFPSMESAPAWAGNPLAYVLDGEVPERTEPDPADTAAAEEALVEDAEPVTADGADEAVTPVEDQSTA